MTVEEAERALADDGFSVARTESTLRVTKDGWSRTYARGYIEREFKSAEALVQKARACHRMSAAAAARHARARGGRK